MIRVTVLYEDARDQRTKGFGLHELVVQCVSETLGQSHWVVGKLIEDIPKGGANKLRAECQRNMDRLAAKGVRVFAVYDTDHVRDNFALAADACRRTIVDTLKEGCTRAEQLDVILLERNLESVLHALRAIAPSLATDDTWARALNKAPDARDMIFKAAAKPSPPLRPIRDALLAQHASFARLIRRIARAL